MRSAQQLNHSKFKYTKIFVAQRNDNFLNIQTKEHSNLEKIDIEYQAPFWLTNLIVNT